MKKFLTSILLFLILFSIVFRDLLLNITSNLMDWLDYPFIVWMIHQDITKILSLNFNNFFDTNIYYPHPYTLLFTDTFLPQSILSLIPFVFTQNLILSFNIGFILVFILNFTSLYLFWNQIFKKSLVAFFGSLFFIFSPILHLSLDHFQMINYWPFFFGLYFLFRGEENNKKRFFILTGLFLTIQFLASVYLSVYMIFSIFAFYFVKIIATKKIRPIFLNFLILFLVFSLTSGIFIKGYLDMRNLYGIKRDVKEYINYSAHLSDYLFTSPINSLVHQSSLLKLWNKSDKNLGPHSSFPGFLIFTLAILAIFKISKQNRSIFVNLEIDREKAHFFIFIIAGLLLSLGPKLYFNGSDSYIHLPYETILKHVPLIEAVRAPARWSFVFFLGITYFALITLSKIASRKYYQVIIVLIFVIFVLEYIPLKLQSAGESYINSDYQNLQSFCSNRKMLLLELPLTHLNVYPNILEGLKYITTVELSSTYHRCNLINGYSGYDLPDNFVLANTLNSLIMNQQANEFITILRERKADRVKFNPQYFSQESRVPLELFMQKIATQSGVEKVSQNLYRLNY